MSSNDLRDLSIETRLQPLYPLTGSDVILYATKAVEPGANLLSIERGFKLYLSMRRMPSSTLIKIFHRDGVVYFVCIACRSLNIYGQGGNANEVTSDSHINRQRFYSTFSPGNIWLFLLHTLGSLADDQPQYLYLLSA